MIDILKNYVLIIAGSVIITAVIMPVVPNKNIKGTLRFAIGVVLCLMLITPISGIFGMQIPELQVLEVPEANAQGDFEVVLQNQIDMQFAEKVKEQIARYLAEKGLPKDVYISVVAKNGGIEKINLAEAGMPFKQEIALKFGMDSARIERQREGE